MLIIGPRLDRPSAIGDEGRPRATSLTVAAVVVAGLFVAVSVAIGLPGLLPAVGLPAGIAVAGAARLGRDRIPTLVVGHLLFLPFVLALLGLLAIMFVLPYGVLVTGFALSTIGLAGTWADVLDAEHARSVAGQTFMSYLSMVGCFVVLVFAVAVGWLCWLLVRAFVGGGPTASLVGFVLLCGGVGLAVRVALSALPVVQLTPVSRRAAVAARAARWKRAASIGAVACLCVVVALAVAWAAGALGGLYAAVPGAVTLFGSLSSSFVAGPLLALGGLLLVAVAAAWLARRLTREFDPTAARRVAAVVAGGVLVVLLVPLIAVGLALPGVLGVFVAIYVAFVGPPVVFVGAGLWLAGVQLGLVPDRASGPALTSAGLIVATVGAGLAGLPAPLVFACAAGALVVWDVSSFGLGVTAELGHLPETRRLELFHAVLGVGLGVAAVVAATGLASLRDVLGSTGGVASAAVLAVVGVLALLALLRG